MLKHFKFIAIMVLALIIIVISVSVLISVFVDINQYKGELTSRLKQQTGLELEINGEMTLSIWSGIKFNTHDIKLSNNEQLIADIEYLSVGVALSSLFITEPEITSVNIEARTLNLSRDKKGNFNFNVLEDAALNKASSGEHNKPDTIKTFLNRLTLNNIQLSIKQFSYMDDLESVDMNLNDVNIELSHLPAVSRHELLIDDPGILVDHSYSGHLSIKQGLFNQYQLSDLSLNFSDKLGDFLIKKISFRLIKEGVKHTVPPLIVDAGGQLKISLKYVTPEGAIEPQWSQPEAITLSEIDLNITQLDLSQDDIQLEARQAHLIIEQLALYKEGQNIVKNLQIPALTLDIKQIMLADKQQGQYDFKDVFVQLAEIPILEDGHIVNVIAKSFLRKFAQKGKLKLSSSSVAHKDRELKNIKLLIEGDNRTIHLTTFTVNAMESQLNGKGQIEPEKQLPQWSLEIFSDKLNLEPVARFLNSTSEVSGHAFFHNSLSGVIENTTVQVSRGRAQIKARDMLLGGMDLDKILVDFQNSQSVGLLDVGAVALLGPAGMLVTKGNDYHKLSKSWSARGNSKVVQLNSDISFENNIATMDDVAFATEHHRLALQGQIDIEKQRFKDFSVATIDKHGCPIYKENVQGSLNNPSVRKVNVVVSGIVNPVNSLISKVTRKMDIRCDKPFYNGVVAAPSK